MLQERRWADFPNVTFTFDCTGRSIGFYADVEFDCMVNWIMLNCKLFVVGFLVSGRMLEVGTSHPLCYFLWLFIRHYYSSLCRLLVGPGFVS
jgi:hypothetical protein